MRKKRVLTLAGSIFLALVLTTLSLMGACAPAAPSEVAEEIAELEDELATSEKKVDALEDEVADLEKEIAALKKPAEVNELRMQHSWSAAENYFFEQYADIVREMSGGQIDISIFSDGEIVTLMETPEATAMGVIDMMHSHPYNWEETIPEAGIEGLPFVWRDLDEGIAIYHQMGLEDLLKEAFGEEFGIHVLGIQPDDYGTMMLTEDFTSLADLEGRRLLLWEPYASMLADNFGIASTYVAPEEIYTSLALGVLDGVQWGGAKCAWDMGFHEVAKYLMLPYFKPSWFPMYAINKELYEGMPADLQVILEEAVYANGYYMRTTYAAMEEKAISDMVSQYGVEVRYLPEEDIEQIFQITLQRLEELKEKGPRAERAANICLDALRDFGYID